LIEHNNAVIVTEGVDSVIHLLQHFARFGTTFNWASRNISSSNGFWSVLCIKSDDIEIFDLSESALCRSSMNWRSVWVLGETSSTTTVVTFSPKGGSTLCLSCRRKHLLYMSV